MQRKRNYRRRARGGFTLIEVLLVVAILVVLGAISVFAFKETLFGSNAKAAQLQINQIENGIKQYMIDHNTYPQSLDELWTRNESGDPLKQKLYMEKPATHDPWNNPYRYEIGGSRSGGEYDIWSVGGDGQDGTDDDVGNWKRQQ